MKNSDDEIRAHNLAQQDYFRSADKRTMLPDDTPYNRRQAAELVAFAGLAPGQHVLEVGCGMGRHTFLLAAGGIDIEGLDLSSQLIDRLQEFDGGRYNITTHIGDILDYAEEFKGRFDAVIGFFMLHHLHANLSTYFSAMTNMIKPSGCLAFMEPNPLNPLYYLQIFMTPGMTWEAEKGILQMREKAIFMEMQSAGLGQLAIRKFGFLPRFVVNQPWGRKLESALENVSWWHGALPFQMFRGRRQQ